MISENFGKFRKLSILKFIKNEAFVVFFSSEVDEAGFQSPVPEFD